MKRTFQIATAITGIFAGVFAQARDEVPLKFDRIDLSDGRTLTKVTVKSYNPDNGRLLLLADGKAMTIPIALLPPPFNERLKAAPSSGGTSSIVTTARPAPAPVSQSNERQAASPRGARAPETVLADKSLAEHQKAARARAQKYFRYEFQIGSNSISVTSLDFELGAPKPVPGWEGRCCTEGKAFLEYYDSKGRSFQRATSTFEVVTEQKRGESLNVIEFARKS